jgi:hypothetical protein
LVERTTPDTNQSPSLAGRAIRLGRRKFSVPTCRNEVLTAMTALSERNGQREIFTVREVYAEMVAGGTAYAEPTAYITMQRMKEPAVRPPYARLEQVPRKGFRLLAEPT